MKHNIWIIFIIFLVFPGMLYSERSETQNYWGIGVLGVGQPYSGADTNWIAIPVINYHWKSFFIEGVQAGYLIANQDSTQWRITFRPEFSQLDPKDSDYLSGMNDRNITLMAGFQLKKNIQWIQLDMGLWTDTLGEHFGQIMDGGLSIPYRFKKIILLSSFNIEYQTQDYANYYYGVSSSESTMDRQVYELDGVVNYNLRLIGIFPITQKWSLIGLVNLKYLDESIQESPIIDKSWLLMGGLSMVRKF